MTRNKLASYFRTAFAINLKRLANKIPFPKNKEYTKFIILGRARTGSTLLHTYLNSHLRILSLGEFLHPSEIPDAEKSNTSGYLKTAGFKSYSFIIQAVGFKMFYEWHQKPYFNSLWENLKQDEKIKIIHLKRKNRLRTLLSLKIAANSQQWSQTINQVGIPANSKAIILSKEECERQFDEMGKEEQFYDSFFEKHPKIEIFYEDLAKQPKKELSRIQHFLGVKEQNLLTLLAHQNPEPLSELILNYDELETAFRNSPWHTYFRETD